jgi:PAS domain S-box-containing protein
VLYTFAMSQASRTLTQDTQLLHDVFNASPIGIAVENLEGQPLFVNPSFCSFLGFSEEELRNKHCVDFSPREDAEKDWALFQQLRAGSIDHYQLEKRYFRRDGSMVWGSLSISLLKSSPSPLVLAMVEDITDKKKAEEARYRHAALVESSDDAIASGTLDGIIVSWNTGAQKIYGYTEAEAVGKPISMLVPPELPDEENKILETLKSGDRIEHFETVRVTKTGKRIHVSLSISPIKDSSGRIVGVSGIARDITERKRAGQALLSSEQRYRLLFERNVAGVAIASLDGRVLDCNDGWARILGYESRDGVLGRHASEFYFNPDERQPLLNELLEKQALFSREVQLRRKDGMPVWVLFNAALNSEHDTPILQATMIDISEWKRAEETLSGMTRKLIEAQEQERARIGRELHDDVNQRLAMLAVELEQLQDNPSEVHSRVQELRQQTTELSNDVQALSHDLHSSKLEYLGVVAGIKSWCKEFAERQRMEIDFKSDVPTAVPLEIGRSLFRVLQEALHNAIKHSGVKRVEVQLREESGEIHLIVSESGLGFDVEVAKQSKGLGLTSMRERVRLVNGTIVIDSKPMGGTTIHVRVPFKSEQGSQRAAG